MISVGVSGSNNWPRHIHILMGNGSTPYVQVWMLSEENLVFQNYNISDD